MVRIQRRWEGGQSPPRFRRLRDKRWNRLAVWRYLILFALVLIILKMLKSV